MQNNHQASPLDFRINLLHGLKPASLTEHEARAAARLLSLNPATQCPFVQALSAVVAGTIGDPASGLKGRRGLVERAMQEVKCFKTSLRSRATMVVDAIKTMAPRRLSCPDRCARLWRLVLLIGEQDEARHGCGTRGLSSL